MLGKVCKPCCGDAYSVLRDLQDQAAKLLRHPNRPTRYLALFAGSKRLTSSSFPFVKHLTPHEDQQVFTELDGLGRIDVLWDEDVSHAENALRDMGLSVESVYEKLTIMNVDESNSFEDALPPELEVFGFEEAVKKIKLFHFAKKLGSVELFPHLEKLEYPFNNGMVNEVDFVELAKSKTLYDLNINLNGTLGKQVGLMTNLTILSISALTATRIPTELGLLTNLTKLGLSDLFEGDFPSEVGTLQDLRSLTLSDTNITSVPTELCNLAALSEMYLYDNLFMKGSLAEHFTKLKSLRILYVYRTLVDTGSMDGWEERGSKAWYR